MAQPPSRSDDGPDIDAPIANPPYIGKQRAEERAKDVGGDGGGGSGEALDIRVAHLETRMGRVEDKLDTIIDRLGSIATRAETKNYVLIAIGSFIALVAVLVTAMGWLETRAARIQPLASGGSVAPQPIIIQVPYGDGVAQPSHRSR